MKVAGAEGPGRAAARVVEESEVDVGAPVGAGESVAPVARVAVALEAASLVVVAKAGG